MDDSELISRHIIFLLIGLIASYVILSFLRPRWTFSKTQDTLVFNHDKALLYSFVVGIIFSIVPGLV